MPSVKKKGLAFQPILRGKNVGADNWFKMESTGGVAHKGKKSHIEGNEKGGENRKGEDRAQKRKDIKDPFPGLTGKGSELCFRNHRGRESNPAGEQRTRQIVGKLFEERKPTA